MQLPCEAHQFMQHQKHIQLWRILKSWTMQSMVPEWIYFLLVSCYWPWLLVMSLKSGQFLQLPKVLWLLVEWCAINVWWWGFGHEITVLSWATFLVSKGNWVLINGCALPTITGENLPKEAHRHVLTGKTASCPWQQYDFNVKMWLTNLLPSLNWNCMYHTHDVLVFYSSGLIAILLLEHHHKQFIVYLFSNNSTKSHSSTIKFLPKRTFFQNAWFTIKCFNKVIVSYFLQRV